MSENIKQFIDQLAAGEVAEAKDTLENELASRSFEALDEYKKLIAQNIFGGNEEYDLEVQNEESEALIENLDLINEVSLGAKIKAYAHHASSSFEHADYGNDDEAERHEQRAAKIHAHILKHHGTEAAQHAERAADSAIFGRSRITKPKTNLPEEYGQLDELSPGTLARAAKAASDPESDMAYDKSHDPQKFATHATKKFGKKIGSQVAKAASGVSHYPKPNTTSGYDKLANRTTSRVTSSGKANKLDVKSLKSKITSNR